MVYFVTETYLKENTSVTKNVDLDDILPLVRTSADMWVRSILGTYFYEDLLVKYNDQTLTANEILLVERIKPAVAWRAAADATIELSYQLKNKGIQTQSGDYSQSPEYKAIMYNYHHKKDKASFYEDRLRTWLIDNKDLFSEFLSDNNTDSTAKDQCNGEGTDFDSNIYLI
jgi:hypothetical protein